MEHHERGRAYRRHQDTRAKRRAYEWLRRARAWKNPDARAIGLHAGVHCKPCSDPWCCGNRRTMDGDTWQELNAAVSEEEQRREL